MQTLETLKFGLYIIFRNCFEIKKKKRKTQNNIDIDFETLYNIIKVIVL